MTANATVGIIGGYGETGAVVAREVLKRSEARVVVAGRDLAKAEAFSRDLGHRASAARVDVFDEDTVDGLCRAVDVIVNCAGPSSVVLDKVARVCLLNRRDYVDPGGYEAIESSLRHYGDEVSRRGLTFISSAGLFPGLTEILPFYVDGRARETFDTIHSVDVYSADRNEWSTIGLRDIVWWIINSNESGRFTAGGWRPLNQFTSPRLFKFPAPVRRAIVVPYYKAELEQFAADRGYARVSGYVGGYSARTFMLFTRVRSSMRRRQDEAAAMVGEAFKRDCERLGRGSAIVAVVEGKVGRSRRRLVGVIADDSPDRGYWMTGLVPALATTMLLDGRISAKGHLPLCNAVDPTEFISEVTKAGVEVLVSSAERRRLGGAVRGGYGQLAQAEAG